MGFFDKFKRNESVVWRNQDGEINCAGDKCPVDCDETCPILCQTLAINMMKMGHHENAIALFKKAIVLAPDFKDAWTNMAAVYGNMNNHIEANKAYKAAYSIDKKYKNAIFGLIISCKNLGQFEEALAYCDEYESSFGKSEADKLREQVKATQNSGKILRQENAMDMALKIVNHARLIRILGSNNRLPNIPEIIVEAKSVCLTIFNDLIKNKDGRRPDIWLSWGAYAGIGAVYHWNVDWDALKQEGIAETLLAPRGSFAMDEYVMDCIGIGYSTPEGEDLVGKISYLSMWAITNFLKNTKEAFVMESALEAMSAMYIFGMVYQMERLGMK